MESVTAVSESLSSSVWRLKKALVSLDAFYLFVCTWAQDERPADLHMAQPHVPVSKTGHICMYSVTFHLYNE
jgi:hypothetical protein